MEVKNILLKWNLKAVTPLSQIPRGLPSLPKKKPKVLKMAYRAAHNLLLPVFHQFHLQPLFIHSLPAFTGLLAVLSTDQTCSCLRAFARTLPSAGCALPTICISHSFQPFPSLLNCHLATEAFPNNPRSNSILSQRWFPPSFPALIFATVLIPFLYTL